MLDHVSDSKNELWAFPNILILRIVTASAYMCKWFIGSYCISELCMCLIPSLKSSNFMRDQTIVHYPHACFVQVDFVMEILSKLVSKQVCQLKSNLSSFKFHDCMALEAWLKWLGIV